MENIIKAIDIVAIVFYMLCALKLQLQMLQQSSYRNNRYFLWLKGQFGWSVYGYAILVILAFFLRDTASLTIFSAILVVMGVKILTKRHKKPLVFTARALRIYLVSVVVAIILPLVLFIWSTHFFLFSNSLIIISLLPFISIVAANIVLIPFERAIADWYINDARRIMASMPNLTVIGITGSYGKTSTKHYLHRILSEKYNTLMTPGSYNTTLGVVRTIREQLKPYHDVFIVEMGAKEIGDIKEICDIVCPSIGILTSVGEQHLESFKSIENVQKTKFELIDSLPRKGLAVLNYDFQYISSCKVENVKNIISYSSERNDVTLSIKDISYSALGTSFSIIGDSSDIKLSTHILGSYNLSNIVASYAVANFLGLTNQEITNAVSKLEAVEHRLQIRHTSGGITVIDDAFNSNPHGAKMALDVLKGFTGPRRILITPGLVELGSKQYYYNHIFGKQAALAADYVIIVGRHNNEAIKEGLISESFSEDNIFEALSLSQGVKHFSSIMKVGDIVLYENDLPDTFR